MNVVVQAEPFDTGAQLNAFQASLSNAGAVASFTGIVRNDGGDMVAMEIEHYPAMTHAMLEKIRAEAMERFDLEGAMIIHRYGRLAPGEIIMMVAAASRHRKGAFAGADFLMDYLKSRAPFWKKEITSTDANWVAAKEADEKALRDWDAS